MAELLLTTCALFFYGEEVGTIIHGKHSMIRVLEVYVMSVIPPPRSDLKEFHKRGYIVAVNIHLSLMRAIRWRGKSIAFAGKNKVEKRTFGEIADMRSMFWGGIAIRFRDGAVLRVDPYAKGAKQLIDAIDDFLASRPGTSR